MANSTTTNIFSQDKAPYLFTLLIGFLAWIVTHIVDRTVNSPIITYSINSIKENGNIKLAYRITNITNQQLFEDLDFFITVELPDSVVIADKVLYPPIKQRNSNDSISFQKDYVKYHFSSFQPQTFFDIRTIIKGTKIPALRISSKNPVLLKRQSFMTWVVLHETIVLLGILIIAILLIIIYLKYLNR